MNDLKELEQRVADHLAGRPVKVRWQDPVASHGLAQAYKTPAGEAVIDISPVDFEETRFALWLHELAHIRLDWDWMPRQVIHKAIPGSVVKSPAERQAWRADSREKRAQEQADAWEAYAKKHAIDYWRSDRRLIEMKLWALLDWRPE